MAQRILNKCAAGVLGEDNSDAEGNEISFAIAATTLSGTLKRVKTTR